MNNLLCSGSGCPLCDAGIPKKRPKPTLKVIDLPSGAESSWEVTTKLYDKLQEYLREAQKEHPGAALLVYRENGQLRAEIK